MSSPSKYTRHGSTFEVAAEGTSTEAPVGLKTGQAGSYVPPLRYFIRNRDALAQQSSRNLRRILNRALDRLNELGEARPAGARPSTLVSRHA